MKPITRAFWRTVASPLSKMLIAQRLLPEHLAFEWLVRGLKAERRTLVNRRRLESLYRVCSDPLLPGGSFVECGVAKGGCIAVMSLVSQGKRPVWGFDSFQGMPELTMEDEGRGAKAVGWVISGPEGVREAWRTLERFNVSGDWVNLVPGWFEDTLPAHVSRVAPIAVLRLDSDWYKSTMLCLETLYDAVVPGGVILVDDYYAFPGCRKAVNEFRERRSISEPLVTTHERSEVRWRKTG